MAAETSVVNTNRRTKRSIPSSAMYDLCRRRLWRSVESICVANPIDAQFRGDDDGYPLHMACQHQPTVRVIRALREAFPEATSLPNSRGELPLHEACRCNASISVLRELTNHDPATAVATHPSAINTLWQARESTETNMEMTNSAVLWHARKTDLRPVNYSTLFWQKMHVVLEAVARYRQQCQGQSMGTLCILHAAVSLGGCPTEVLHYCLTLHADQVSTRDGCGRLPLHVAVSVSADAAHDSLLKKIQLKEQSNIIRLLERCPEAAQLEDPNEPRGRFALHSALLNGHGWHGGVRELFQNFPQSLGVLDPVLGLYPFQMATHDVDTVFQLLRNGPSALKSMRANPHYIWLIQDDHVAQPQRNVGAAESAACLFGLPGMFDWSVIRSALVSTSLSVVTFWSDFVRQGLRFFIGY